MVLKKKTVVDKVSLNFYENQITNHLGHNGAEKGAFLYFASFIFRNLFFYPKTRNPSALII